MKFCTDCKETKDITFFSKNKTKKDGLESQCKECRKKRRKEYVSKLETQEKIKAYRKKYQVENKEKLQMKNKEKWSTEDYKLYMKKYREENREIFRKSNRMHAEKNASKLRVKSHVNMAKGKGLLANWSEDEYREMMEYFDYKCAISGKKESLEVDHFIPLSTGYGGTHKGNLVPLNATINQSKAFLNPFEWIKGRSDKEKNNFKKVVSYLSEINKINVSDFERYVYKCYETKVEL